MKINLYDFDKTIYNGDSSFHFILYSFTHHPKTLLNIPRMAFAAIRHYMGFISKTEMKNSIFAFVKYLKDIDTDIDKFWKTHKKNIKKFYMDKNHKNDVIISASPEFLLEGICNELGVKKMMATVVDKKTGKISGYNCHDVEKVRRLNEVYDDYEVMESYSDSKADIPILKLAKKAYYVKGEKLSEAKFEN